jgi:hypothetical protein
MYTPDTIDEICDKDNRRMTGTDVHQRLYMFWSSEFSGLRSTTIQTILAPSRFKLF